MLPPRDPERSARGRKAALRRVLFVMGPKRHHYVPKFLLQRFCRDGLLWVYDRSTNEFRRQQPVNTAVIKDYYSAVGPEGEKNLEAEELLSRIEGAAKPVIDKVDAGSPLSDEDRQHLAVFVGFLAARVPDFEKTFTELVDHVVKHVSDQTFSDPDRTRALMARYHAENPDKEPIDAEQLTEFIQSGQYNVIPHRNWTLATMLEVAIEQANLFAQMNWVFSQAPEKTAFVISDTPLSIVEPRPKHWPPWMGIGITTPGAAKVVPLSQRTCLLMGDRGDAVVYRVTSAEKVRDANLVATARCDRFVFARDERQLRSLVDATGIAGKQRQSRLSFM